MKDFSGRKQKAVNVMIQIAANSDRRIDAHYTQFHMASSCISFSSIAYRSESKLTTQTQK